MSQPNRSPEVGTNAACTYAITGASGYLGRSAATELLAKGHSVRVLGRNCERLRELHAADAEIFIGDLGSRIPERARAVITDETAIR